MVRSNSWSCWFIRILAVVALLAAVGVSAEMRLWTSEKGQKIQAELVKFDGKTVWLRLAASGKTQEIPLAEFSPEDQRLLKSGQLRDEPSGGTATPTATATAPDGKRTPEQIRAEVARKAAERAAAAKANPPAPAASPPMPDPATAAAEVDTGMLAELRQIKHLLPMTPEAVAALQETVKGKQVQVGVAVDAAQVAPADEEQKLRLLRLDKVRLRIVATMSMMDAAGNITAKNAGTLNLWVVDPDRKKLLVKTQVPFAKLVPS